ncbi:hypothetical protein STEG23_011504 [Scotinomys teguina]
MWEHFSLKPFSVSVAHGFMNIQSIWKVPQYSGESKAQNSEEKELIFHSLKRLWGSEAPEYTENCYSSGVRLVGDGTHCHCFPSVTLFTSARPGDNRSSCGLLGLQDPASETWSLRNGDPSLLSSVLACAGGRLELAGATIYVDILSHFELKALTLLAMSSQSHPVPYVSSLDDSEKLKLVSRHTGLNGLRMTDIAPECCLTEPPIAVNFQDDSGLARMYRLLLPNPNSQSKCSQQMNSSAVQSAEQQSRQEGWEHCVKSIA